LPLGWMPEKIRPSVKAALPSLRPGPEMPGLGELW
jgi:hypothetical protein